MQESMQAFYDQFVEKVAEARHTSPEKIDQIAQGRVWTGQQARQVGLVDQLGGLQLAVNIAKQRAHIPVDEEVELVTFPPRRSLYEVLTEQFEQPSERGARGAEALLSLSARATVRSCAPCSPRPGCSGQAKSWRICLMCFFAEVQSAKCKVQSRKPSWQPARPFLNL